jgi:hypothetical protein
MRRGYRASVKIRSDRQIKNEFLDTKPDLCKTQTFTQKHSRISNKIGLGGTT